MMSAGVQDIDHVCPTAIQVDEARLEGAPPGTKAGVVFDYGPGNQTPTAHRVTHLNHDGTADCVHAVATSAGLNHPITFAVGPTEAERGQQYSARTRVGLARTARWQGVDTTNVGHDVQEFTRAGETRMLVPHAITETSSAVARLFDYNKNNRQFLNGKYHESTRNTVGDGFVVSSADISAAKETLATHLKPVSAMAEHGLRVRYVDLGSRPGRTAAPMTVRFQLKRSPLTEEMLTKEDATHAHAGMLTLGDAQTILGEETLERSATSVGAGGTAELDDVFALPL